MPISQLLPLKMKQEIPGKQFNLYTVCKVVEGRDIPLYDECLTKEQYDKFFNKPSYYQPEIDDKEDEEYGGIWKINNRKRGISISCT